MTRTIYPDDVEFFKETVRSLGDDEVRHCMIRMKNMQDEYRWMIMKMSVNVQMLSHGTRLTDIVVKDAVELEKSTTGLENIIERFRFLMSVQEAVIFEYSSITNRFYVYSFDYNVNTVFLNEDFDYFRFHALSEGLIAESSRETFESFFESVKAGISRFSFELESGIISGGDQTAVQIFSGFSETDSDGNRVVLGLITAKKTVEDPLAAAGSAFEANLDPLTRLFNKKTVTNYARNHITSGENKSVTIAIIDIDDFKYINDTYGHLFGDDIICTAASVIKKETGSKGTAGRIGGDEFMVVLYDVPGEMEIRSILRAIRSNIGMLCAEKAEGLKITCSMGIARFPDDAPSYEQLFRTADKALYIAKEKGKDRYVIYNREKHGAVEETDSGAITTALSGDRRNTDKTEITGSLITGLTVDGNITVPEALKTIVPAFDIDRIRIYTGDDLKLTHSYPASENSESADYLMSDGYTDNFTPAGMFVMDNTDILEGRNPGAFARMKADGVKAAVQYICCDGIKGMISFELTRLFKKWPQMDVSFMNILGKVIFKKLQ